MQQWEVKYSHQAEKQLRKLDNSVRLIIEQFVDRLPDYPNPRDIGKALRGQYSGLWRYSVGDYRLICSIHDNVLVIEVVKIGH
ncbi:MAG: type II toxin-antitoxin system RelE/ParE family toxin [Synergistaceae bacterium]|nr:type II toxin-antitoxin system RelE/ParE family toxin [Synergistaceae bacterium]